MDTENALKALTEALQGQTHKIEVLEESLSQRMADLSDIGWTLINGVSPQDDVGPSLETLHMLAPNFRDMAATNPLFTRGAQLRHSYVFGRGINFSNLSDVTKNLMNHPYNRDALFSQAAMERLNLAKFTDGNVFVVRDTRTNILTVVPIQQIRGTVTDPDDTSRVRYFLRTWDNGTEQVSRWYITASYRKSIIGRGRRGGAVDQSIQDIPVAQDAVMYHTASKRQVGWSFGVPDVTAAAVWAVAYAEYLKDNALLVKALQKIAWVVQQETKAGRGATAMAVAQPGVGGTGIIGSGASLASAGVPSAQVDMNNGQPLAAMVATSLGVPVIALLSSPGATGGSYGAATTLDTPTIKGMTTLQESWGEFFREVLVDMGSPSAEALFPNIVQDEAYREAQSVAVTYTSGLIHQDEAREAVLRRMDVPKLHDTVPVPDHFNAGSDINDTSDPVARQGNSGAVQGGNNLFDDTNHDND